MTIDVHDMPRYGKALQGALESFEKTQERSGRTTKMLEEVKDGDLVVVASAYEKDAIVQAMQRAGKQVWVYCVNPNDGPGSMVIASWRIHHQHGRVIFSHEWLLSYYRVGLTNLAQGLANTDRFTKNCAPRPAFDHMAVTGD